MRTHGDLPEGYELSRSCCSPDAADDARRVAQILGIPFFVLNVEREFGARVIDAFVDSYLDGATPNPCQACNQYIKFDELLRRGLAAYGADAVATGHYARLEHRDGRWRLLRAADADKDQTYFLWVLDQEQLTPDAIPAGRAHEARGARDGRRADPADRPEAGVAGDLLRAARRLPRAARGAARLRRRPRTDRRRRWRAGRHPHRLCPLHRRPAPRARRRARRGGLRARGAPADEHRGHRPPRRGRAAHVQRRWRPLHRRGAAVASGSAHRSASGIGRRTCRPRSRWSAATGSSSRPPSRSGPRRRARRPCCTTATSASAEGASPEPEADRA